MKVALHVQIGDPLRSLAVIVVSWGPIHGLSVNSLHFSKRCAKLNSCHLYGYHLNDHCAWLMVKTLHNLTLCSLASSDLIYRHRRPIPTRLQVFIALKIYLALSLMHTQLSTQFFTFMKITFFSVLSSQTITIISIFPSPRPGSDSCYHQPALFQATVLAALLQIADCPIIKSLPRSGQSIMYQV